MDIYRDYFTREELVRVLAQQPYTPGLLGTLGLFEPVPLTSTTFAVEEETKDGARILTAHARGAQREQTNLDKRKVHTFPVTSQYGDQATVFADEVLNARGAGTAGVKDVIENRRARALAKLRLNVDLTHENLRLQCILNPASTEFGAAKSAEVIAVQTAGTKLRKEIFTKIKKPMEAALDGIPFGQPVALCSDGYWEDLIVADAIEKTYLNWQAAAELRGEVADEFVFGGVRWMRYRGAGTVKIPDNEARVVPSNVQGAFWLPMAPNDTMESVGSGALGQPYYVGAKAIEDSQGTKGWELSIQSHVRAICGRPGCIIPLTKS